MFVLTLGLFSGCGPEPVEFTLSPETLAFGTVEFPPEMPDGGYAELLLTVTNSGETDGRRCRWTDLKRQT